MKFKLKFTEVKSRCRKIVKSYRKRYGDSREFPQFSLGLAGDGREGYVQLMWKPKKAKEAVFSDAIAYESLAELSVILKALGDAWESSN